MDYRNMQQPVYKSFLEPNDQPNSDLIESGEIFNINPRTLRSPLPIASRHLRPTQYEQQQYSEQITMNYYTSHVQNFGQPYITSPKIFVTKPTPSKPMPSIAPLQSIPQQNHPPLFTSTEPNFFDTNEIFLPFNKVQEKQVIRSQTPTFEKPSVETEHLNLSEKTQNVQMSNQVHIDPQTPSQQMVQDLQPTKENKEQTEEDTKADEMNIVDPVDAIDDAFWKKIDEELESTTDEEVIIQDPISLSDEETDAQKNEEKNSETNSHKSNELQQLKEDFEFVTKLNSQLSETSNEKFYTPEKESMERSYLEDNFIPFDEEEVPSYHTNVPPPPSPPSSPPSPPPPSPPPQEKRNLRTRNLRTGETRRTKKTRIKETQEYSSSSSDSSSDDYEEPKRVLRKRQTRKVPTPPKKVKKTQTKRKTKKVEAQKPKRKRGRPRKNPVAKTPPKSRKRKIVESDEDYTDSPPLKRATKVKRTQKRTKKKKKEPSSDNVIFVRSDQPLENIMEHGIIDESCLIHEEVYDGQKHEVNDEENTKENNEQSNEEHKEEVNNDENIEENEENNEENIEENNEENEEEEEEEEEEEDSEFINPVDERFKFLV